MWDGKPYRRHDSVISVMPREKFIRLLELQHGSKYKWENDVNRNLTSRAELARIAGCSESTIKRRLKEWNIAWFGHPKTGHWVFVKDIQ